MEFPDWVQVEEKTLSIIKFWVWGEGGGGGGGRHYSKILSNE